jgi:hypothetical protein
MRAVFSASIDRLAWLGRRLALPARGDARPLPPVPGGEGGDAREVMESLKRPPEAKKSDVSTVELSSK